MKYIIEIKPEYEDSFKGLIILGAKDSNYFVDTLMVDDLEELNSDYINEHFGELQDEAYQRGLEDAWEAARKIALMDTETSENVTGYFGLFRIMENLTAMQAIEKLKAYEDKHSDRIEVGDEVQAPRGKAIVTAVKDDFVHYFYSDGDIGCLELDDVTKTGKHYDIASILEAMRTHD